MGVYREISFGNLGIYGRMHLPQAYRSLPRPSSLIKPSHPPTGVFAPALLPDVHVLQFILSYGISHMINLPHFLSVDFFVLLYDDHYKL